MVSVVSGRFIALRASLYVPVGAAAGRRVAATEYVPSPVIAVGANYKIAAPPAFLYYVRSWIKDQKAKLSDRSSSTRPTQPRGVRSVTNGIQRAQFRVMTPGTKGGTPLDEIRSMTEYGKS